MYENASFLFEIRYITIRFYFTIRLQFPTFNLGKSRQRSRFQSPMFI